MEIACADLQLKMSHITAYMDGTHFQPDIQ